MKSVQLNIGIASRKLVDRVHEVGLAPTTVKSFYHETLKGLLMNEHNIFVSVDFDSYIPDVPKYSAFVKSLSSEDMGQYLLDAFSCYDSYHAAFEEGLYEAMKLINTKSAGTEPETEPKDCNPSQFLVTLDNVGNIDYGQSPFHCLPGTSRTFKICNSIEECVTACRDYIDENELGGGNWTGGTVFKDSEPFAYISYNGRVWDKDSNNFKMHINRPMDGIYFQKR